MGGSDEWTDSGAILKSEATGIQSVDGRQLGEPGVLLDWR